MLQSQLMLTEQASGLEGHNLQSCERRSYGVSCGKPLFRFRGYSFTPVIEGSDRIDAFRLRAEIYDDEFGWARASGNIEQDEFDNYSTHYVVKSPGGETVATIRTIDHCFAWMADNCFGGVFAQSTVGIRDASTIEASRLCIRKEYRSSSIGSGVSVLDFLLAGLLFHNNLRGIENTYIITFATMYRMLARRGLDIRCCSETITMADGCRLRAFVINNRASLRTFKPLPVVYGDGAEETKGRHLPPTGDKLPMRGIAGLRSASSGDVSGSVC